MKPAEFARTPLGRIINRGQKRRTIYELFDTETDVNVGFYFSAKDAREALQRLKNFDVGLRKRKAVIEALPD